MPFDWSRGVGRKGFRAAVVEETEDMRAELGVVLELLREVDAYVIDPDNDGSAQVARRGEHARKNESHGSVGNAIRDGRGGKPGRQDVFREVLDVGRSQTKGSHDADEQQPADEQISQHPAGPFVKGRFAGERHGERQGAEDDVGRADIFVVVAGNRQQA